MATDDVIIEAWTLLQDFLRTAPAGPFLPELTKRLDDALVAEIPELATDGALRADLDASTHALLVAFFGAMAEDPGATIEIPQAVLGLARTMAIRGYDVGVLLRAYRVGQRLAWRELLDIITREIGNLESRLQLVTFVFERLSEELERIIDASVSVFTEERDRWFSGALARKADTVQAILRGDSVDWDQATRALGHRLRRLQLGLVLWLDEGAALPDSLARLEAAAGESAKALDSPPPLTIPDGSRSMAAWLTVAGDADLSRLNGVVDSAPHGLRIAAGIPAYGVNGFRSSHQQATRARSVAQASDIPAAITRYADVEVVSAFLGEPASMRELVARELAGLASRDDATGRLRETALAYLRAGGSARGAAAALGVHKNTVLYRLRGIEEALGRPLDSRRLPLEVALQIVAQLGDGVLP